MKRAFALIGLILGLGGTVAFAQNIKDTKAAESIIQQCEIIK